VTFGRGLCLLVGAALGGATAIAAQSPESDLTASARSGDVHGVSAALDRGAGVNHATGD
jgi:hypothetical protein